MKIDLYTKSILSVIAACLLWLCFGALTPTASAQASAQKVVVVGWDRPLEVVVVDGKGTPLIGNQGLRVNFGAQPQPVTSGPQPLPVTVSPQPLPVTFGNQTLPVALTAIERTGNWQPIPVDVMRPAPTLQPTP